MVAMDFFAASNSYDFFNQYCSNLLKNLTVRGLNYFDHVSEWKSVVYMHIHVTHLFVAFPDAKSRERTTNEWGTKGAYTRCFHCD